MIDVQLMTLPYKSQTHNNNIVHRVSGRKDAKEKRPMNDADGVGAGERVMEMESARTNQSGGVLLTRGQSRV